MRRVDRVMAGLAVGMVLGVDGHWLHEALFNGRPSQALTEFVFVVSLLGIALLLYCIFIELHFGKGKE